MTHLLGYISEHDFLSAVRVLKQQVLAQKNSVPDIFLFIVKLSNLE